MKEYKPVIIEWLDSKGFIYTWEYLEDAKPLTPQKCVSVGFLFEDHRDYKTILQSYGGNRF